jgi:uncharacterized membrane protein YoaK (UPF0700 family)
VAGFINACLLGVFDVPVSHMSGAVTRLSIDANTLNVLDFQLLFSIVAAFLGGSLLSGLLIGRSKLLPGRRYGVTLIIEGAVLALATYLLLRNSRLGVPMAAMACGVQNAMASSYYGLVIRTTHVTGIITDIGVMLGHWIRHRRIRAWKLLLLVAILLGFFSGGVLGVFLLRWFGSAALSVPAVGCLLMGLVYCLWFQRDRHTGNLIVAERVSRILVREFEAVTVRNIPESARTRASMPRDLS